MSSFVKLVNPKCIYDFHHHLLFLNWETPPSIGLNRPQLDGLGQ